MKKRSFLFALISVLLFSVPSFAHFLWLNVDDYTPALGQKVNISLGWGHKFPSSLSPRPALIQNLNLFVMTPKGEIKSLSLNKNGQASFYVSKPGVYLVVALSRHFVSKTTEGYLYKSRDQLKDKEVIYSKWSETTAMALISVGKHKEIPFKHVPKSNFYFLPTLNPSLLKQGQVFSVKIYFKNRPIRTWLYATYAGFSPFKDTYAYVTRADKNGMAQIKLLQTDRPWLLKAEIVRPYTDPQKADKADYKCTLTFGF